ncbi:hypothetical protein V6N13_121668 [Hibiscus sabdariffa]
MQRRVVKDVHHMAYVSCLVIICSSSSGLEGAVLETFRPASVLPFMWMEVSGVVHSVEAKVAGVEAGESVGTSQTAVARVELFGTSARCGVGPIGLWCSLGDFQSKISFSSSDERCTSSVLPAFEDGWLLSWRMCSGAASSDWTGGRGDGVLGAEPNGESGVVCLLACVVAGVEVGLGIGNTCGVASGDGEWAGLVGGVGSATLMGAAFATSILLMYSFLDQLNFSSVYLSHGLVGTAALRQRADIMQGKPRMPLSFLASCYQLLSNDFPHIEVVARHDDVYQHQPSAVDCLVVEGWHQIPFDKCVPQLTLIEFNLFVQEKVVRRAVPVGSIS